MKTTTTRNTLRAMSVFLAAMSCASAAVVPNDLTESYYSGDGSHLIDPLAPGQGYLAQVPLISQSYSHAGSVPLDFEQAGDMWFHRSGGWIPAGDPDHFGVVWYGTMTVGPGLFLQPGAVTFGTASDDGSMILVDGRQVVNNNGYHSRRTRTATVNLGAGEHEIIIGWFEGTGGANMEAKVGQGASVAYDNLTFINPGDPAQAGTWGAIPLPSPAEIPGDPRGLLTLDISGTLDNPNTVPGSASYGPGTDAYAIAANGEDIWDRDDGFRYAYLQVPAGVADFELSVRVDGPVWPETWPNAWTKAGIMARQNLGACSPFMMLAATRDEGMVQQYRDTPGGYAAWAGGSGARQPYASGEFGFAGPVWLKLLRKGDTFYGYYSEDGVDWIRSGYWYHPDAHTIVFDEPFYVGMFLTSHAPGTATTAVFGDFSFKALTTRPDPSGWTFAWMSGMYDLNMPSPSASLDPDTGRCTITAAGHDIWDEQDGCAFVCTVLEGDFSVRVRLDSDFTGPGSNAWAKAGIMVRDSLMPGSMDVYYVASRGNGKAMIQWRDGDDEEAGWTGSADVPPDGLTYPFYLRLDRSANTFTGYYSQDGANWTRGSSHANVAFGNSAYVGLALTSHEETVETTMVFSNLWIPYPGPASPEDVGDAQGLKFAKVNGRWDLDMPDPAVVYDAGTRSYTMTAAGHDMWQTQDGCGFAYTPVEGDFSVRVRLDSDFAGPATHPWAKAGIMVRDSLMPGSMDVYYIASRGNGKAMIQWRNVEDGGAGWPGVADVPPNGLSYPFYLRMDRVGNIFTGFYSPDGEHWTRGSSHTNFAFGDSVYVGLALSSCVETVESTMAFSNLWIGKAEGTRAIFYESFDDDDADGFIEEGGGVWGVVDREYTQYKSDTGTNSSWVAALTQYTIEVDCRPLSGQETKVIYAHADSGENYRVDFWLDSSRLCMPAEGQPWESRIFVVRGLNLSYGQTYHVKIEVSVAGVKVWVDGVLRHDQPWAGNAYLGDGNVGLGTYAGTSSFDNLLVYASNPGVALMLEENFDDGTANGFHEVSGIWDTFSLEYTQPTADGTHRSWVYAGDPGQQPVPPSVYTVEVDCTPIEGSETKVLYAHADTDEDYRVDLWNDRSRLSMPEWGQDWSTRYFVVEGLTLPYGQTYHVKIDVRLSGVKVWVDHALQHDQPWANDVPLGDGKVGVGNYWASSTFDNVTVTPLRPEATILRSGNMIRLDWQPFGEGYRVQYTDDLLNGTWQDVQEQPPTGSLFWLENVEGTGKRFYRIASP